MSDYLKYHLFFEPIKELMSQGKQGKWGKMFWIPERQKPFQKRSGTQKLCPLNHSSPLQGMRMEAGDGRKG